MNKNKDHPAIKTNRENSWAMWIPGFNLGWHGAFLVDFRHLVGDGCIWDFKNSQDFTTDNCPVNCDDSVTLCGTCFFYDVVGNIHYGWVGRAGRIRRWFLLDQGAAAQEGGVDDPRDVAAIKIGMDLWDGNNKNLCDLVDANKEAMYPPDDWDIQFQDDCELCDENHAHNPTGSVCSNPWIGYEG